MSPINSLLISVAIATSMCFAPTMVAYLFKLFCFFESDHYQSHLVNHGPSVEMNIVAVVRILIVLSLINHGQGIASAVQLYLH